MRISRLRLQLAAWFAAAVFAVVLVADLGLYGYLRRNADARFTAQLRAAAAGVVIAVRREQQEPGATLVSAATNALNEWPLGPEAISVSSADGQIHARGSRTLLAAIAQTAGGRRAGEVWTVSLGDDEGARLILASDVGSPALSVVVARSTGSLDELEDVLTGWLLVSVPGVSLFALVAGYLLARRTLRPVHTMTQAISQIAPDNLTHRLPVRDPPDELDHLAAQFNDLLIRLAEARDRNRAFLVQAAHQLKTPLTIVRGESELGLERDREAGTYREILERVRRAADQMAHRVDGLFLLAQAEAGERPSLTDDVELDGLALECADLMRGRAQRSRHPLELGRVEPGSARGNYHLLREALLELLENALKYASPEAAVRISAYGDAARARLAVSSAGPAFDATPSERSDGRGLGLSIVRWIAEQHGGVLTCDRAHDANTFSITWPIAGLG